MCPSQLSRLPPSSIRVTHAAASGAKSLQAGCERVSRRQILLRLIAPSRRAAASVMRARVIILAGQMYTHTVVVA